MNQERLLKVLRAPHVSEKSAAAADGAQKIVFKVLSDATKNEVKAAVETLFEVKVDKVNVVNIKGKKKRSGAIMGKRDNLRKAYVTLAEGQDIDFMGGV